MRGTFVVYDWVSHHIKGQRAEHRLSEESLILYDAYRCRLRPQRIHQSRWFTQPGDLEEDCKLFRRSKLVPTRYHELTKRNIREEVVLKIQLEAHRLSS